MHTDRTIARLRRKIERIQSAIVETEQELEAIKNLQMKNPEKSVDLQKVLTQTLNKLDRQKENEATQRTYLEAFIAQGGDPAQLQLPKERKAR